MKPVIYDFKRAIKSRGVLAVMAFMIVFSLAVLPLISSGAIVVGPASQLAYSYYSDKDGYHVLVYAYNIFGQPVPDQQWNISAMDGNGFKIIISTNSSGLAIFDVPANSTQLGSVHLSAVPVTGTSVPFREVISFGPLANRSVSAPIQSFVRDESNSSRNDLFFFAAGPNLTKPDFDVYYKISSNPLLSSSNLSGMTYLTTLKDYATVVKFLPPSNATLNEFIIIAIVDKNGAVLYKDGISISSLLLQQTQPSAKELASSFLSGVLGVFVPLMAILGAYSVYARDRVSGILESVLVRPVTRRGLLLSRFISVLLAVSVAVVLTIIVVDAIIWVKLGGSLDADFILSSWAALCVEAGAFIGIMFLLSQFTKSTGALIGIGVGLFLVLDFLWGLILFLALSLSGSTFGSADALKLQTLLDFFNPSQYLGLVHILQTGNISGVPVSVTQYGVTALTVAADGLAWILLPVCLALWVVSKRD